MKKLFILLGLAFSLSVFASPKNVLMFVSEGFYAPEYYTPRAILEKAGFKVTVATKYKDLTYPDKRNKEFAPVKGDITFDKVVVRKYDAFVFAGGNGAWEDFFPNKDIHKVLTKAMKKDKLVGLLCSATGLLGVVNNLSGDGKPIAEGRSVTGYRKVAGLLKVMGKVNYSSGKKGEPYVVQDERLITGRDPISSELFGKTLVKALKK